MPVRVVHVRHMGVGMPCRLVTVPVAVFTRRHDVVRVIVVAVVVAVRVLVLERLVLMFMSVRLRQVQHDAGEHQHAAGGH